MLGRLLSLSALLLLSGSVTAIAQSSGRTVVDPPTARIVRAPPGARVTPGALPQELGTPAAPATPGGEAVLDLNVDYSPATATIFNPATGQDDAVKLRSYQDARATAPPPVPFVAPTVEVFPGETVRITLHNKLPKEPNCEVSGRSINIPHCFNRTNLHSHGLWINPSGNGDNVLLSINPTVSFQYEFNISPTHPAGTFWYHPHRHGSTALQVASGMAGVLIIKGTRPPTPDLNGDIDTLLSNADGSAMKERIVLLQQIQYACRDANGGIKTDPKTGDWVCARGDVGGIEGYDQFGPPTWQGSGRYTSINGQVLPTFSDAQVGRIERWRLVHAGVRDTIKLQFRKMRPGAAPFALEAAAAQDQWIAQNCPGAPLSQFAVATDGLTRSQAIERPVTVLQPGYREDLLMVFPEAGDYCVIDDQALASTTVNTQVKSRKFLGQVSVAAGQNVSPNPKAYLQAALTAAADILPADVRQKVRADIANDLRLTSFVPHPTIEDNEVTGTQTLAFNINLASTPLQFIIDGKPYDANRIDRVLTLGSVDQWLLTSNLANHPFHIHVNPFQVVQILDPNGKDVSVTGENDDPQYANLKGAWKDTLFVKRNYIIVMRTRYERYIGDFVLHCHILDHEDQGMMQNVRIAIPDGMGGVAQAGHGDH
jgi:FtsP/CotA-like multicopper oxidase with cupredoxin domain